MRFGSEDCISFTFHALFKKRAGVYHQVQKLSTSVDQLILALKFRFGVILV